MSRQRVIKQTVYAGGFFTFLAIIVVVFALALQPSAPPAVVATPTPPEHAPIIVEQVETVRHGAFADVVARLRNPNPQVGVAQLPVTFTLTDDAGASTTAAVNTYVLPGSIQYVVLLNQPERALVGGVVAAVSEQVTFSPLPTGVDLPRFNTFPRDRTSQTVGGVELETQRGVVTNTSTVDVRQVDVVGLARDTAGKLISIGQTSVSDLLVGEQREVVLQWPKALAPIETVTLVATTNILRPDAIIETVGDPGLLR